MLSKPINILISPLDWGLGHATRCIPVIKLLLDAGHRITIAGSGRSILLLQKEFPELESITLNGFSPTFKQTEGLAWQLLLMLPRFISTLLKENRDLKTLIKQKNIELVISDNRYGMRNKQIKSIIITHQVMIKAPLRLRCLEYPLYLVSKFLISRFDECWIPDYDISPGLSGDLSHKYLIPANALFIGPLSRFTKPESLNKTSNSELKITAIISGTEPQRSTFENLIIKQFTRMDSNATIISGKPESPAGKAQQGKLTILANATVKEMKSAIADSGLIICRSGYSSIMDLEALRSKALFVPTPGQTEQLYLAELHQAKGNALWRNEADLNLQTDIPEAIKYPGFTNHYPYKEPKSILERIVKK